MVLALAFTNCTPSSFTAIFQSENLTSLGTGSGSNNNNTNSAPTTTQASNVGSITNSKAYRDCLSALSVAPTTATAEPVSEMGTFMPFPLTISGNSYVNGFNFRRIEITGSAFGHYFWIPNTVSVVRFFGMATSGNQNSGLYLINSNLNAGNIQNFTNLGELDRVTNIHADNLVVCGFNIPVIERISNPIRGKIMNVSVLGSYLPRNQDSNSFYEYVNLSVAGNVDGISSLYNSTAEIFGDVLDGVYDLQNSQVKIYGDVANLGQLSASKVEVYGGNINLIRTDFDQGVNEIFMYGGNILGKIGTKTVKLHRCSANGTNCVTQDY